MPPARLDRADVARDLRRGAAVGALDQGARRRPPDAAVAHRQDRRHPEVQERRSLTDEQIETIVRSGSTPARRRATRRTCRPPKTWPEDQGWNFAALFGQKEPDLIIKSYDFTMPAVSQDAWDKRVTPSGITEPRWVRAIEIRPDDDEGPQDHAPRDRVSRTDRAGRRRRRRACRRRSWNGPSASRAR